MPLRQREDVLHELINVSGMAGWIGVSSDGFAGFCFGFRPKLQGSTDWRRG